MEVDSLAGVKPDRSPAKRTQPAAKSAKATKKKTSGTPNKRATTASAPAPQLEASKLNPDPSGALQIDTMMLRALIVEQPELLEPGLQAMADDAGREVGARFATDVGTIDLLATDDQGAYVVVTVPEQGDDDTLIPEMLRRVGWVRKHLVKSGEDVRGIIVIAELDDEIAYAAAAVSDTIRFKSYALSLKLVDLNV
jgi:RecB family endonuclease NucS